MNYIIYSIYSNIVYIGSLHRSTSEPYSKHEQRISMPDEGAQSLDSNAKPTPPDSSSKPGRAWT